MKYPSLGIRKVETADADSAPIMSNLVLDFSSSVLMVYFLKKSPPLIAVDPSVLRANRVIAVLHKECVHVEGVSAGGLTQDCLSERPKKEQKEINERISIGVFTVRSKYRIRLAMNTLVPVARKAFFRVYPMVADNSPVTKQVRAISRLLYSRSINFFVKE